MVLILPALSRYYHLPALSVKAACYELFLKNMKHFEVKNGPVAFAYPRGDLHNRNETPDTDEVSVFYEDMYHPYPSTGHRVIGDCVSFYLGPCQRTAATDLGG